MMDSHEIPPYKLTVASFSVSYALDIYKGGDKQGNYACYEVRADPPIPIEDLPIVRLDVAFDVARTVVLDAVTRMCITQEEAADRIRKMKENTEALRESLLRKRFLMSEPLADTPVGATVESVGEKFVSPEAEMGRPDPVKP
ncbi:MAG: hypothetical protein BWY99_02431 [Synergistetes bacterium ADurb.BinA166]|nr:MAG: hypothetical protein BWY99_02431 [Synergistetes bacterium ADurb.BinA166]